MQVSGKRDTPANQPHQAFGADLSTLKSRPDESQLSYLKISEVHLSKEDKGTFELQHSRAYCHPRRLSPIASVQSGDNNKLDVLIPHVGLYHRELPVTS